MSIKTEINKEVSNVLAECGFENTEKALIDFALSIAFSKKAEFEEECEMFENKYKMSFKEFEKKINKDKEEKFEEYDDYLAWKFAEKGKEHWQEKVRKLRNAVV